MSCFFENKGNDKFAVLQFEREQLLYDVRNYCYVEGHVMQPDTDVHLRHTVQDVGEEGNVDRVTRVFDLAIAQMRELLYPYTKHNILRPVLNDKLKETSVYGLLLKVPADFSRTTLVLLERLIHEYLVCRAVADWLSITNPQKAEIWTEKASDAESEVRTNLMARMGRTRRRPHPF